MVNKCQKCGDDTYNPTYCYKCLGQQENYRKTERKSWENE